MQDIVRTPGGAGLAGAGAGAAGATIGGGAAADAGGWGLRLAQALSARPAPTAAATDIQARAVI
ncbi:hypothetical protein [Phenylobacterium sp.]|uniref:hypothetical protein n=1 Tax=Phenylobacterium sp. TaxID=1871053 RepID=UPI00374D99BC